MVRVDLRIEAERLAELLSTGSGRALNRVIRHLVFVEGLKTSEARDLVAEIERGFHFRLVRTVQKFVGRLVDSPRFRRSRAYLDFATKLRQLDRAAGTQIADFFADRMLSVATSEASFFRDAIEDSIGGLVDRRVLQVPISVGAPTRTEMRAIVSARPFEGKLLREHVRTWSARTRALVERQVNLGIVQGSSIDEIVRGVRGTRAGKFRDGVLHISRRNAEAMVRTSVNAISNFARQETFRENSDLLTGEMFVATLDDRTTQICASLDGKVTNVGDPPLPPMHFRCRSNKTPVLRKFSEMFPGLQEPPEGTRAAKMYDQLREGLGGQVPESLTYGRWLRMQPVAVQDEILGVGKGRLFRRGVVPIERFSDSQFRSLTLRELEALEARLAGS